MSVAQHCTPIYAWHPLVIWHDNYKEDSSEIGREIAFQRKKCLTLQGGMTDIMKRIIETTRYIMQFVDSMKNRYNTELAVDVSKRTIRTRMLVS